MSRNDYLGKPGRDFIERRDKKRRDGVSFVVTLIAVIGWFVCILALLFLDFAKPEQESFWSRFFHEPVQSSWNRGLLLFILAMLVLDFLMCMLGFVLNITRHKRKADRFHKGIISLWIISGVIILIYLLVFGTYIF